GIRDLIVTGVQTCALPISGARLLPAGDVDVLPGLRQPGRRRQAARPGDRDTAETESEGGTGVVRDTLVALPFVGARDPRGQDWRSEERRVGKEGRARSLPA